MIYYKYLLLPSVTLSLSIPVLGHWQTIQPRESTIAHSTRQLLGKGWHPLMFPWEEDGDEEEDGAVVFPVCPALP